MDAISPRALRLIEGDIPLVTGPGVTAETAAPRDPPLRRILRFATRWRWVLLGGIVAGAILGVAATLVMTRQYVSTVRLEIARDTARVTKIDGVERETSIGDMEFYQTQYGLLRATGLAERVARDLQVIDDRKFFAMFGREDLFDAGAAELRDPARRAKRVEVAGEILLDQVTVAPIRGSSLVDISVTTPDPALSQRIAATWSKDFIDSSLERRFEASSYARHFLETRIEALRLALEDSERKAVTYAARQEIINLPMASRSDQGVSVDGGERSLVTDNLGRLNDALATATAKRIDAQTRLAAISRPDASPEALNNPAIAELRRQRAEVASEYTKKASIFAPGNPQVKALADQLADIDASLAREVARIRQSLDQEYAAASEREQALAARVEGLKGELNDLRQRSIQYNIYVRDADTNRDLYDSLLQRYKEIGVAGSVQDNNIAVVNAPKVPDRPARPSLIVNLLLSILAGGLAALALAAALNQIDEAIGDTAQIKEKLGLPLLGALPKVKQGGPLDALNDLRSDLVESYLAVQANLELATPHGIPRSLAVTSTRPGEGKSTSAIALAQSLARIHRKVVLVDADMRSPTLHGVFGIANTSGVSNFLAGADNLATALHPSGREGLSVMPAGPPPPNTADLLTGGGLRRLIDTLQERYDHVIVDSPPVLGLADAQLTAAAVEGVIYVVEAGATQARMARNALDRLRQARANLVGTVLTKFEPRREHFSYGYGYDYGYGYGHDRKQG